MIATLEMTRGNLLTSQLLRIAHLPDAPTGPARTCCLEAALEDRSGTNKKKAWNNQKLLAKCIKHVPQLKKSKAQPNILLKTSWYANLPPLTECDSGKY